ncbi:MAG: four helix bundle protein [Candidatus Magasanikbacteria bacterium]
MQEGFHEKLKRLINEYILVGYEIARKFPNAERYGMWSQATRALLSIMLNYIEGFGRTKKKVLLNFYETSFGSLKESIYIFYLANKLHYITEQDYQSLYTRKEEIAKMLWSTLVGLRGETKDSE